MNVPQDPHADPASDLGPVWDVLDALPRATASATLAATTVELAAVAGDRQAAAAPAAGRGAIRWLGPAAVVIAALVTGAVPADGAAAGGGRRGCLAIAGDGRELHRRRRQRGGGGRPGQRVEDVPHRSQVRGGIGVRILRGVHDSPPCRYGPSASRSWSRARNRSDFTAGTVICMLAAISS